MSAARSSMTHRATIERPSTSTGPWGHQGVPTFTEVRDNQPCKVYTKTRIEVDDTGKQARVEELRAMVPATADVLEGDRLTVHDRRGILLFDGPMVVLTAVVRGGSNSSISHRELTLERHTASLPQTVVVPPFVPTEFARLQLETGDLMLLEDGLDNLLLEHSTAEPVVIGG